MSNEDLKQKLRGGEIVAAPAPRDQAIAILDQIGPSMADTLQAIGIPPERFRRIAMNAMLANGAALVSKCTKVSIAQSVLKAAELGLEVGHGAAIVPFGNVAQLVIEAKGLIKLAMDSGMMTNFDDPVIVYEGEYRQWKDEAGPHFRYEPTSDLETKPVGVLFGMKLASGEWKYVFTDIDRIKLAASKSKNGAQYTPADDTMWQAMWKKTGVIHGLKYIPKSPKFVEVTQKVYESNSEIAGAEIVDDGYREGME